PYTLACAPLRRRAPRAWLASLRSLASLTPGASPRGPPTRSLARRSAGARPAPGSPRYARSHRSLRALPPPAPPHPPLRAPPRLPPPSLRYARSPRSLRGLRPAAPLHPRLRAAPPARAARLARLATLARIAHSGGFALRTPYTLACAPLRRRAPRAWLASLRSL